MSVCFPFYPGGRGRAQRRARGRGGPRMTTKAGGSSTARADPVVGAQRAVARSTGRSAALTRKQGTPPLPSEGESARQ